MLGQVDIGILRAFERQFFALDASGDGTVGDFTCPWCTRCVPPARVVKSQPRGVAER